MRFLFILLLLTSCGHSVPGDPFGWSRPEELTTICHDGKTQKFNYSNAQEHLKHHKNDYPGVCK